MSSSGDDTWDYVDHPEDLGRVARAMEAADWIAVDTESDSMHSYFEKVCLIQVATDDDAFLIDPLALPGRLEELAPAFADPSIRKIFHGADYDVVCLKRDFGFEIRNLFDTMIASQFLDLPRIGLADLVGEFFEDKLEKKHSRTNWARRPLSDSELLYSYLDVKYLIRLAEILEDRLTEEDLREETEIEFLRMEEREPTRKEFDPEGFLRIRGSRDLEAVELAVLRELYLMRDKHARQVDRPPFKILANDTLLRVAREKPRTRGELGRVKGVTSYVLRRYGDPLLRAVARGVDREGPPKPRRRRTGGLRLSPHQQRQQDLLREWRKAMAAKRKVPTVVVLPNHAILDVVVAGPRTIEELGEIFTVGPKRAGLYGEGILRILRS